MQHALSSISPKSLQNRLNSDLELSNYHLKKDFKGFVSHYVNIAEAFQLVDDGKSHFNHHEVEETLHT